MLALALLPALTACGTQALKPSEGHIQASPQGQASIPAPVTQVPPVPVPRPAPKTELYSVSVVNVPVQEILFALARDARLNVDIHSGISGNVTLNAIDQSLPQILSRISKQVDMRYEIQGQTIAVMPDTPYLRNYKIDYLNMIRDTTGDVAISASISGSSTSTSGTGTTVVSAFGANNTSNTKVTNNARNHFWETLERNVKDLLRETDKIIVEGPPDGAAARPAAPPGTAPGAAPATAAPAASETLSAPAARRVSFREAASVIANPETGVLTVRATARQHEKVQEFLDQVAASAKRQVMIEATIVAVELSDRYQQGIDWSIINTGAGFSLRLPGTGGFNPPPSTGNVNLGVLTYDDPQTSFGSVNIAVKLLETFGTTRVLSSPKISVLNNQTAILKVVRNEVYFTITPGTVTVGGTGPAVTTDPTATPNTVPIGLIMSVTPQISESDSVMLNVRPTISRKVGDAPDPTPNLTVPNLIPIIQINEMESVLKVDSGQIAVMGGLMQDERADVDDKVPYVGYIPFLGEAFTWRNDTSRKIELVIFLRPVVVKNASLDGDYASFRSQLPTEGFLAPPVLGPGYFRNPPETLPPSPLGGN
ncbi:MAG TPA: pilus (MSHA type) biogenesis protein MshL [Burkholderiales bacterium]|nr:pilus (MSHA type) biogenesis protein MshL [Burkholderiales bacterium]